VKAIFSSPHSIEVAQKRDLLEQHGIACAIFNDSNFLMAEGAISPHMPELWVEDDAQADRALEILRQEH
jgi:hypothetical protein